MNVCSIIPTSALPESGLEGIISARTCGHPLIKSGAKVRQKADSAKCFRPFMSKRGIWLSQIARTLSEMPGLNELFHPKICLIQNFFLPLQTIRVKRNEARKSGFRQANVGILSFYVEGKTDKLITKIKEKERWLTCHKRATTSSWPN